VKKLPPSASTSIARYAMIRANHSVAHFITSFLPDACTEGGDGRLQWAVKWSLPSGLASGAAEVQLNLVSSRYLELPREGKAA
jgi:hypothetical protein